jgi:hypothetical protein
MASTVQRLAAQPLGLMLKPRKSQAHSRSRRHRLRRDAVRSCPADIIRRRKENFGYRENYKHAQRDVKAWIDLNSP